MFMIEVRKLGIKEFQSKEYKQLLRNYYSEKYKLKLRQFEWFRQIKDYVTVIALVDGVMVGQASAYACNVKCKEETEIIYWGCDTFILEEYRGLGLGRKMQQFLYDNVPNFTSVGYSKINGIIKRKCGAKKIGESVFSYYGVCTIAQFLVLKVISLLFKKEQTVKTCKLPMYYLFNRIICNGFCLKEENYLDIENEVIDFINLVLETQYDFYVIRNKSYMKWKYVDNKTMTFRLLTYRDECGKLLGLAFVTDAFKTKLSGLNLTYSKVLDLFIKSEAKISNRDFHFSIIRYFLSKGIYLDGLASLFDFKWLGKISFRRDMLSTFQPIAIKAPYISYSDQDLEQMI